MIKNLYNEYKTYFSVYLLTIKNINKIFNSHKVLGTLRTLLYIIYLIIFPFIFYITPLTLLILPYMFHIIRTELIELNGEKYLDCKYFWKIFLDKNNIPTPKLHVAKYNNKLVLNNSKNYNMNKKYIYKPNFGDLGFGIKIDTMSNLLKNLKKNDGIIEELCYDKFNEKNYYKKIRVITLFNGKVIAIKVVTSQNNKLVSTFDFHSDKFNCDIVYCANLSTKENYELKKICNQLKNCHKSDLRHIFSIGWDLIFCDDKINVVEGNIGHGIAYVNYSEYSKEFIKFIELNL